VFTAQYELSLLNKTLAYVWSLKGYREKNVIQRRYHPLTLPFPAKWRKHTCIPSQNSYLNHGARLEIHDLAEHARHVNAIAITSMSVRITVKAASGRQ
jgi:hypothetical protein